MEGWGMGMGMSHPLRRSPIVPTYSTYGTRVRAASRQGTVARQRTASTSASASHRRGQKPAPSSRDPKTWKTKTRGGEYKIEGESRFNEVAGETGQNTTTTTKQKRTYASQVREKRTL